MRSYNIQITEPAEEDLYEFGTYISKELLEPETAKKVISKIAKVINSLKNMPHSNALLADERLSHLGLRIIMADNYIIFYIIDDESEMITVIRILYNRRDWINIL